MTIEVKDKIGRTVTTFEVSPETHYLFSLETVWGHKDYDLSFTYIRDEATHLKDPAKLSGAMLQSAKR